MTDFSIKTAIAGVVGASIWSETADNGAAQLAKYGSAMLSAPVRLSLISNLYSNYFFVVSVIPKKNCLIGIRGT